MHGAGQYEKARAELLSDLLEKSLVQQACRTVDPVRSRKDIDRISLLRRAVALERIDDILDDLPVMHSALAKLRLIEQDLREQAENILERVRHDIRRIFKGAALQFFNPHSPVRAVLVCNAYGAHAALVNLYKTAEDHGKIQIPDMRGILEQSFVHFVIDQLEHDPALHGLKREITDNIVIHALHADAVLVEYPVRDNIRRHTLHVIVVVIVEIKARGYHSSSLENGHRIKSYRIVFKNAPAGHLKRGSCFFGDALRDACHEIPVIVRFEPFRQLVALGYNAGRAMVHITVFPNHIIFKN